MENKLFSMANDNCKDKARLSLSRLYENLSRLEDRHHGYMKMENRMQDYDKELQKLQLNLVDKMEAFHQQIYSTLSVVVMVCNYIPVLGSTENHPKNSIQKFLSYIESNNYFREISIHTIEELLQSVKFRAFYIDHPQNKPAYNWMSFKFEEDIGIIYYTEYSNKCYYRGYPVDPRDPDYMPPVDCRGEFVVSPHRKVTYDAMKKFICKLFNFV